MEDSAMQDYSDSAPKSDDIAHTSTNHSHPSGYVASTQSGSSDANDATGLQSGSPATSAVRTKLVALLRRSVPAQQATMDLGARNGLKAFADVSMETLVSQSPAPALQVAKYCVPFPRNRDADAATKLMVDAYLGSRDGVAKAVEILEALHRPLADVRDRSGRTALHHAAQQGHVDTCSLLMQHGLKPCVARWETGDTPLHDAARTGKKETLALLLSVDPQAATQRNTQGVAPVMIAYQKGHADCVRLLCDHMPQEDTLQWMGGNDAPSTTAAPYHRNATCASSEGEMPMPLPLKVVPVVASSATAPAALAAAVAAVPQVGEVASKLTRLPCELQRTFTISAVEAFGGRGMVEQFIRENSPHFSCRWRLAPAIGIAPGCGPSRTATGTLQPPVRVARWALLVSEGSTTSPSLFSAQAAPKATQNPASRGANGFASRVDAVKALKSIGEALDRLVKNQGGYDLVTNADLLPEYTTTVATSRLLAGGGGGMARNYGNATARCVATLPFHVFETLHSFAYCEVYERVMQNVEVEGRSRIGSAAVDPAAWYESCHAEVVQRLSRSDHFCYVVETPLEQLCFAFPSLLFMFAVDEKNRCLHMEMSGSNPKELELCYEKLSEMVWCSDRRECLPPFPRHTCSSSSTLNPAFPTFTFAQLPRAVNHPPADFSTLAACTRSRAVGLCRSADERKLHPSPFAGVLAPLTAASGPTWIESSGTPVAVGGRGWSGVVPSSPQTTTTTAQSPSPLMPAVTLPTQWGTSPRPFLPNVPQPVVAHAQPAGLPMGQNAFYSVHMNGAPFVNPPPGFPVLWKPENVVPSQGPNLLFSQLYFPSPAQQVQDVAPPAVAGGTMLPLQNMFPGTYMQGYPPPSGMMGFSGALYQPPPPPAMMPNMHMQMGGFT